LLLPLCNAAIDVVLLIAAVHVVDAYRSTLRQPWPLWEQSYRRVDPFFLRNAYHAPPPKPIVAIWLGTVPATILAGVVSEAFLPNGWLGWRLSSPFDFRWVCLHFCFALTFWYATGRWVETQSAKWAKLASAYVLLRLLSIPAFLRLSIANWAALCGILLSVVWIAFAVVLSFKGLVYVLQRFTSAKAPIKA
jgi:hypothetical protein